MESIVGAVGNIFRSKKTDKSPSTSTSAATDKGGSNSNSNSKTGDEEDATKLPPREITDAEFEIIRINKHARYQDRKFRFGKSCIYRIRPDGELAQTIPYSQISAITVRSVIPCRFQLQTRIEKPFELISGEIKEVVKEITKRANSVSVIFEEGSEKFSYDTNNPQGFGRKARSENAANKKELLSTSPATPSPKNTTPKIAGGSTTASQTASGGSLTVQERLKEQDEDLEQISTVVGDLRQIASQMGDELSRQNNELDDLDVTVTRGVDRLKKDNKRIQKML